MRAWAPHEAGTSLPVLELAEWETDTIPGRTLTPADRRLQQTLTGEAGRLDVDELRDGVRIGARAWVGVVRFESFEVRVVPKLAGDALGLVDLIAFTTGLDALRRNVGVRTLHAEGAGLLDLVALLLAEACEKVVRAGLLADYVEREDDLAAVRGRLLADRQVLRRFGRVDRVVCRFDEHEQDIVENRLLAAALGRCATRVAHAGARRRVRRLLPVFHEVCRTDELDLDAVRGRIAYHRLNEHYRDAHALAWLVLDGLSTRDLLVSGTTPCFAFLIDMNRLFETFVWRLVERLLAGSGLRVHSQRHDPSIIVDAATQRPYARVIPDLLVETSAPGATARVAVDAKYKRYDERKLGSGDVYQSFLYAYAYGGAAGTPPAALVVYPATAPTSPVTHLRVRGARASAEIFALGLPIPAALAEVSRGERGPATAALREAVQQALGQARALSA